MTSAGLMPGWCTRESPESGGACLVNSRKSLTAPFAFSSSPPVTSVWPACSVWCLSCSVFS